MKLFYFLLVFSCSFLVGKSQNLDYLSTFTVGGSNGTASQGELPYSMATDNNGNIIVVGQFFNNSDFDPSTAVNNLTTTVGENFIAKYDSLGNFLWVKSIEKAAKSWGQRVKIDKQNNIYVLVNVEANSNTRSCYTLALDKEGEILWENILLGDVTSPYDGWVRGTGLSITDEGDVIITGFYFQDIVDFESGNKLQGHSTKYRGFIATYNSAGAHKDFMSLSASDHVELYDMDYRKDENNQHQIVVTGYAKGQNLELSGETPVERSNNTNDQLLMAVFYTLDGNLNITYDSWFALDGASIQQGMFVRYLQSGTIVLAGRTNNTLNLGSSSATTITSSGYDTFFAKYTKNGTLHKFIKVGSTTDDIPTGILLDGNDNMYLFGYITGSADLSENNVSKGNITFSGIYSTYVIETDSSLNFSNITAIGGDLRAIVRCGAGHGNKVHFAGEFSSTVDFNKSSGENNLTYASTTGYDMFVSTYNKQFDFIMNTNTINNLNVSIYPNPFNEDLIIETPMVGSTVNIFDLSGKLVNAFTIDNTSTVINSQNWKAGFYTIVIQNENQKAAYKVIKN